MERRGVDGGLDATQNFVHKLHSAHFHIGMPDGTMLAIGDRHKKRGDTRLLECRVNCLGVQEGDALVFGAVEGDEGRIVLRDMRQRRCRLSLGGLVWGVSAEQVAHGVRSFQSGGPSSSNKSAFVKS